MDDVPLHILHFDTDSTVHCALYAEVTCPILQVSMICPTLDCDDYIGGGAVQTGPLHFPGIKSPGHTVRSD